ncbi:histidine kinase [Paenibacillus sp. YYML68]|uniref:hybrid sensor histidine kinase/response regulator n=1 Tax=Paenibacillus sp. YYML68 TaxID=2909250 RepID=UPI0024905A59|nr:histidine kinase [Paenibacillus sp. YYML68]
MSLLRNNWRLWTAIVLLIAINVLMLTDRDHEPQARNGVLELSEQGGRQEAYRLQGEWSFYPNQLLTGRSTMSEEQAASAIVVDVPGSWDFDVFRGGPTNAIGYGTYHLRVQLGNQEAGLHAFWVPLIRASHRLFVNGEEIGGSGIPADESGRYSGEIKPYIAYKQLDAGRVDLFVQVANFDHTMSGGIIQSILMGPPEHVIKHQQKLAAFEFGMIVIYLMLALFFAGLQAQAPRNGWCWLSLFFVSLSLLVSIQGTRWLLYIWPHQPFGWVVSLYWLCSIGILMSMFMFINNRHYKRVHPWFRQGLCCLSLAMTVCIMLLPTTTATLLLPAWLLLTAVVHLYINYVLLRSLRTGDVQTKYEFWSYCLFTVQSLLNSLYLFGFRELNIWYFIQAAGFSIVITCLFLFEFFRAYRRTRSLTLDLQRTSRFKSQFMAGISRQMRAPLTDIMNIAEARLHTDQQLQREHQQDLRQITAVGWTMRRWIDNLIDFSHLREDGLVLHKRPLQLYGVVKELMERQRYFVYNESIRFVNDVPAELPAVHADEQRMLQIVTGMMQALVRMTAEGTITAAAAVHDEHVQLELRMQGKGITRALPAELRLLLEQEAGMFKPSLYGQGDGLDLFLIVALIELHDGQLRVHEDWPRSAAVRITFPIDGEMHSPSERERTAAACAQPSGQIDELLSASPLTYSSSMRSELDLKRDLDEPIADIVIVQDDPLTLNVLINVLAMYHCRVTVVREGQELLNRLRSMDNVDLVVIDRHLQGMSGLELCASIRHHYSLFDLPILLLTPAGIPVHALEASQAGANDYIVKPVDASELRVRVRTLVELKRSVSERIRMELAFLQAQIKPHFLFNTLNSIAALSRHEPDQMTRLLNELGYFLRESFRFDSAEELISIERELRIVKSYLHIEKVRFDDWLSFDIERTITVPFRIPMLTLQPLVENAVCHGIMRRAEGGHIWIGIQQVGREAWITVKDNGVGMSAERLGQVRSSHNGGGVGIANIERRMKKMFGYGLDIASVEGQGTEIRIRLPLEKVGIHESDAGG